MVKLENAEKTVEECHKYQAKLEDKIECLEQENELFRQAHKTEQDRRRNLEQKLDEIKEIVEEAGNTQYLTFPDFNLKQNVKMLMGQFNGYLQQILQKISEVTND